MSGEQPFKKRSNKSGITNSKALGVMVLIGALLVFQVVTFVVGVWRGEDVSEKKLDGQRTKHVQSTQETALDEVTDVGASASFVFDPNTISKDSLVLLGFSPKQAQVVINYRTKGGRFRRKEDFSRMYVVSEEKYEALKDRIVIRKIAGRSPETDTVLQVKNVVPGDGMENTQRSGGNQQADSSGVADRVYGKKRPQRDSAAFRQPWRCDLNRADSATLVKLYGIGGYFAKKILRYRERLGGWFVQAEQLLEIEGLEQERFDGFRDKLLVDTTGMRKFLLDTLGRAFMERHPYIGPYAARGILLYRESRRNGEEVLLDDLARELILSKEDVARLKNYVKQ